MQGVKLQVHLCCSCCCSIVHVTAAVVVDPAAGIDVTPGTATALAVGHVRR